jgi:hypothetical protein
MQLNPMSVAGLSRRTDSARATNSPRLCGTTPSVYAEPFATPAARSRWVRLKRSTPRPLRRPSAHEKTAWSMGSHFAWSDCESLDELKRPKRFKAIERDYERRVAPEHARRPRNPLREGFEEDAGTDEAYRIAEMAAFCLTCQNGRQRRGLLPCLRSKYPLRRALIAIGDELAAVSQHGLHDDGETAGHHLAHGPHLRPIAGKRRI